MHGRENWFIWRGDGRLPFHSVSAPHDSEGHMTPSEAGHMTNPPSADWTVAPGGAGDWPDPADAGGHR